MSDHDPQLCEIDGCLLCMPGPDQSDEDAIRADERARLLRALDGETATRKMLERLDLLWPDPQSRPNLADAERVLETAASLLPPRRGGASDA